VLCTRDIYIEEAMRYIIAATAPHPRRQTALFSATWPQSIQVRRSYAAPGHWISANSNR
jgi:superfamily II DNA/RNA helicase